MPSGRATVGTRRVDLVGGPLSGHTLVVGLTVERVDIPLGAKTFRYEGAKLTMVCTTAKDRPEEAPEPRPQPPAWVQKARLARDRAGRELLERVLRREKGRCDGHAAHVEV